MNKEPNREITYQVGWKKGKIRQPGTGNGGMKPDHPLLAALWRPLPFLPSRALAVLLVLLPALGFAALLWLVGLLARVTS